MAIEMSPGNNTTSSTFRRRNLRLPYRWKRFGRTALACYAIVGLFGAAYGLVRSISPHTAVHTAVIWGLCAATPLAIAFLWDRLTGFRFLGVEITLAGSIAQVDGTLATALSASDEQYFSNNPAILALIERVLGNPSVELLELNLRTSRYWWSTRIFLQAALVADFTNIQRLVFVAGDEERRYVGMASPSEVRRGLAQPSTLDLELAYASVRKEAKQSALTTDLGEVHEIIEKWAAHTFSLDGRAVNEGDAKTPISAENIADWITLERDSIEWIGPLDTPLLQALVLERAAQFVPLNRPGYPGGSIPWKRGWSHGQEEAAVSDIEALSAGAEGACRAHGRRAPTD